MLIAFLVTAAVCFVGGRLSNQAPVSAEGEGARGGGAAALCGDVNGDGARDISDVIYLCSNLFLGGPEPVCSDSCCFPDTGQMKCYTTGGEEIDCTDTIHPRQDGLYQTGCPMEDRFVENGNGTVTDTCTGLMWQKMTAQPGSTYDPEGNGYMTWKQALAYCSSLGVIPGTDQRFDGAGYVDWRLPSVHELQLLIHYGKEELPHVYGLYNDDPKINVSWNQIADGFHIREYPDHSRYYEHYWSSTTVTPGTGNQTYAHTVEFTYGSSYWYTKDTSWYVRAVRTIQPGE
jgi:hypothetical protein